jgi:hypothetical protein
MLSSYKFILKLCHISFISWFRKVMGKDIDKDIKEDHTEKYKTQTTSSVGKKVTNK